MKAATISDALQYLSDDILAEGRPVSREKTGSRTWITWAAAAACMALVVYAGARLQPAPAPVRPVTPGTEAAEPVAPTDGDKRVLVVSAPEGVDDEQACYRAPEPGECLVTRGVQAALDQRKGMEGFLLAFHMTKLENGVLTPLTDAEAAAEYRRLQEAGVTLYETALWNYEGPEGVRVPCTEVTVALTAEELADFPASSDYGYMFYFPCNGDSSAPEDAPGDALVLPDW